MKQFDQDFLNLQNLEQFFQNEQKKNSEKIKNNEILTSEKRRKSISRFSQKITESSLLVEKGQRKKNNI